MWMPSTISEMSIIYNIIVVLIISSKSGLKHQLLAMTDFLFKMLHIQRFRLQLFKEMVCGKVCISANSMPSTTRLYRRKQRIHRLK